MAERFGFGVSRLGARASVYIKFEVCLPRVTNPLNKAWQP